MPVEIAGKKIVALMYHRVAHPGADPWSLCVSPANFEAQLSVLKNNFKVISTADAVAQVLAGRIIENAICVSFDDGYTDNLVNGKPLLEKYDCPATFFIATGLTGQENPFWWDELGSIFLLTKVLPEYLSLSLAGNGFEHSLREPALTDDSFAANLTWKYYEEPPTDRCATYMVLWERLISLPAKEIANTMCFLREWAASSNEDDKLSLPMNSVQLAGLFNRSYFTAGTHTHSHVDLSAMDPASQFREINDSQKAIMGYGGTANIFSYPHGRYNEETIGILAGSGISAAFSTAAEVINANSDIYRLGRFQVFNWKPTVFENHIAQWML